MKNDKKWLWIVLAIVVIIIGWLGLRWWNRDVVTVKIAPVVVGPIEQVVSASGIVDAPVYELGTKMGGRIKLWLVKEGDLVRKGQLLAEFDNYEQAYNDFLRVEELVKENYVSRQAYDNAKTTFDSSRIIAPNTGIVAKINYDLGETALPGQIAVTVVNYGQSWVEAQIDEIDIGNVKIGDKVKVTSDVYPDEIFDGQIYWIAPLAELRKVGGRVKMDEESYVFPCKIRFLGNHQKLMANMSVNVEIVTKKTEVGIIVPREALISRNDETYVFVINKRNRVRETKLALGIRSYTSVEAVSGVAAGENVAISNVAKLKNFSKVKIEH